MAVLCDFWVIGFSNDGVFLLRGTSTIPNTGLADSPVYRVVRRRAANIQNRRKHVENDIFICPPRRRQTRKCILFFGYHIRIPEPRQVARAIHRTQIRCPVLDDRPPLAGARTAASQTDRTSLRRSWLVMMVYRYQPTFYYGQLENRRRKRLPVQQLSWNSGLSRFCAEKTRDAHQNLWAQLLPVVATVLPAANYPRNNHRP
jgi:hypothetical protein